MYRKLDRQSSAVMIDRKMTVFRFNQHEKLDIWLHFGASDERRAGDMISPIMKRSEKDAQRFGIRIR
jgi:hypothetical protein